MAENNPRFGRGPQGIEKCKEIFDWLGEGGYLFERSAASYSSGRVNGEVHEFRNSLPKAFVGFLIYCMRKMITFLTLGRKSNKSACNYGANVGISQGETDTNPPSDGSRGYVCVHINREEGILALGIEESAPTQLGHSIFGRASISASGALKREDFHNHAGLPKFGEYNSVRGDLSKITIQQLNIVAKATPETLSNLPCNKPPAEIIKLCQNQKLYAKPAEHKTPTQPLK